MLIKLAWKNTWRNRRRTFITISAIGFAVLFAVMMRSVNQGMEEQMVKTSVENRMGYIQVHAQGFWDEKTVDNGLLSSDIVLDDILDIDNVKSIRKSLETSMIVSNTQSTRGTLVSGLDLTDEIPKNIVNSIVNGKLPAQNKNEVLLGIELADYLGVGIGDTLVYMGTGYHGATAAGLYIVSGLLDFHLPELNRMSSYMALASLQELIQGPDLLTSLNVNLVKPKEILSTQAQIAEKMGSNYEVMTWKELTPDLDQLIQTSIAKGYIMNFILYLIISFVMFGTVLMATQERKYEMGVLQAIGMKRHRAMLLVIIENIIMSILGVVVGTVCAFPIMYYFNKKPLVIAGEQAKAIQDMGIDPIIPFSTDPTILINHGLIVLVISLCLVIYPIMVIKRLKPIDAMKL